MSGQTPATTMTLHAHIKELRTRLFLVAAIFIVASTVAYIFRDVVIDILLSPLDGQHLSYLTPGGGFSFIFKVIMWAGIAASLPFLLYVIYGFLAPALPPKAQRKSLIILVASFVLLCLGALFGYIYAIPGAIHFLLTFAQEYVNPMLTADSYLNFVLVYTIGLGVLFQIPLIMIIINWITPLGPKKLLGIERYVIVGAFIIAALITPTPDAVNQSIIAAPVIAMYQVGFIGVLISHRQQRKRDKHGEATTGVRQTTEPESLVRPLESASAPRPATQLHIPERQPRVRSRSIDGISRAPSQLAR